MKEFEKFIAQIKPVETKWVREAMNRQNSLTKPPGSLGVLEDIACRIVAIQESLSPRIDHKRIVVFAGDHGITEEGISPYPQEVTAQMVANFLRGGAAINAIARAVGAEVIVVDIGVKTPIPVVDNPAPGIQLVRRRVRQGSRNFLREAALTQDEVVQAISVGWDIAMQSKAAGVELIGLGEMGIGNTTTASVITAALTGLPASQVTGRGTGANDDVLARKQSIVTSALKLHSSQIGDAFSILRVFGGLEVAGLTGICFGAAAARISILVDGFIASAAAALAAKICPTCADYMFAAHLSTEPGHRALLEVLHLKPILNLGMRLGEGTGAALGMKIVEAAALAFTEMATFESAQVSGTQILEEEDVG